MRFSADTLDLSRLPPPEAIKTLDFETVLASRVADLKARLAAAGIDYDVGELETDPLKIEQESDAFRELLDLAAINDAVRAVMLPLASGANLDHLASFYNVARMPAVAEPRGTAQQFPEDWESDTRFRLRAQLAPEAFSCAGALGGYVFHAMTADAKVKDVGVRMTEPGNVEVAVLSTVGNGAADGNLVEAVRARLVRPDIKPLTDVVSVVAADILNYAVTGTIYVPPGPDPATVKAQAEAAIDAAAAAAHRVGLRLYTDTFLAALRVGPTRHAVLATPAADVFGVRGAPWMTGRAIAVELLDE